MMLDDSMEEEEDWALDGDGVEFRGRIFAFFYLAQFFFVFCSE